jgi:hypothetical protein
MKYKIIDNFLSDLEFEELKRHVLPFQTESFGPQDQFVNWVYAGKTVPDWAHQNPELDEPKHCKEVTDIELVDPVHDWYFANELFFQGFRSPDMPFLNDLLNKIEPLAIHRIQANFTVQQEKRRRNLFHIDYNESNKRTSMNTSIFYMNTTNGPTLLEDGTEIECIANRLVTYPYDTYHTGVLCTDQPYRIVINLNYFTAETEVLDK